MQNQSIRMCANVLHVVYGVIIFCALIMHLHLRIENQVMTHLEFFHEEKFHDHADFELFFEI